MDDEYQYVKNILGELRVIGKDEDSVQKIEKAVLENASDFQNILAGIENCRLAVKLAAEMRQSVDDKIASIADKMAFSAFGVKVGDFVEIKGSGRGYGVYKIKSFSLSVRVSGGNDTIYVRIFAVGQLLKKDGRLGKDYDLDFTWETPLLITEPHVRE